MVAVRIRAARIEYGPGFLYYLAMDIYRVGKIFAPGLDLLARAIGLLIGLLKLMMGDAFEMLHPTL
jgi:hypothetical protein